ncbi:SDR family NAD(P)-dependent oxidoreductase [Streptomyces sp. NPDC048172]|uniref:SDR family NAD(P)-dependent oxidoreductase n=1 Tax=Streptomyces sp. NPDC048172 TaxID=3365505 RepID=UPI003718F38E
MTAPADPEPLLFPLSCRSPRGLAAKAAALAEWLSGPGAEVPLSDLAHTLARRRSHHPVREAVHAHDPGTLVRALRSLADRAGSRTAVGPCTPGVVFVFSGYGSHWNGMGRALLREPAFAEVVGDLGPVLDGPCGGSLREALTGADLAQAEAPLLQPLLFATQLGLAAVWQARGLRPDAVLGQSMGELAAAVVSGAMDRHEAARAVTTRARVMQRRMFGHGTTAVVDLPPGETERRLRAHPEVEIAVHSSTRSCVVAGPAAPVDTFLTACEAEDIATYPVRGGHAPGHSSLAQRAVPDLLRALDGIGGEPPSLPFYSTALADPREVPDFDAAYWTANVRNPVRLLDAVNAALEDGMRVFVEVAPHTVAARPLTDTLADSGIPDTLVLASLRKDAPDTSALRDGVARAYAHGCALDWARLYPSGRLADVPTTVWHHAAGPSPSPVTAPAATAVSQDAGTHPLLGVHIHLPGEPERHLWQQTLDTARLPWLADHRIGDLPLLSATSYCEMALAAGRTALGTPVRELALRDAEFRRMLPLAAPVTLTTALTVTEDGADIEFSTHQRGATVLHATAHLTVPGPRPVSAPPTRTRTDGEAPTRTATAVYDRLSAAGLRHGPAFAALTGLTLPAAADGDDEEDAGGGDGGGTARSRVRRPDGLPRDARMHAHPALLDACLHGLAAALVEETGGLCVPARIGGLRLHADLPASLACAARLRPHPAGRAADIEVGDESGRLVAELRDVVLQRLDEDALPVTADGLLHEVTYVAAPLPPPPADRAVARTWLIAEGADDGFAASLAAELERRGATAETLALADLAEWTGRAGPSAPPVDGVVLLGWSTDPVDDGLPSPREDDGRRWASFLGAARAAARHPRQPEPPRLYAVTRATEPADAEPDLAQAGLPGLFRSLRAEVPELRPTLVDLDQDAGPVRLADELCSGADHAEVVLRGATRRLARVTPVEPGARPVAPSTGPLVRPDGGYVITGGTGGLGLATARWLAAHGARHLVLNGRSAPGPEAREVIGALTADGTHVEVVQGDLAEPGVAERLMDAVTARGAAVRGIVHAAGLTDDALVSGMDAARTARVWRPKVTGAWRLHLASAGHQPDWWIGYSSSAGLLGSPGQTNYAAANTALDALALWRRARGLPALAVDWGPWAETGGASGRRVTGMDKIRPREAFAALEELLAQGRTQAGVLRLAPDFALVSPHATASSYLAPALPRGSEDAELSPEALALLGPEALRRTVGDRLAHRARPLLGGQHERLPEREALVHLGLDSLAAVRIKNAVRDDFGTEIPVTRLLQGATLADLTDEITARLTPPTSATTTATTTGTARNGADDGTARAQTRSRSRRTRTAQQARRRKPQ